MTKNELKTIIKECLLEILTDGLGTSINESVKKKKQAQVFVERKQQEQQVLQRKNDIKSTISQVTNDPIMQSILEHTAKTTMQEQITEDRKMRGGVPGGDDFDDDGGDPGLDLNVLGGSNKNWMAAAFGNKKQ